MGQKIVLILAENISQSEYFAKLLGLDGRRNTVSSQDSLRGLSKPTVLLCGTWFARPDAQQLQDILRQIGADVLVIREARR
jgi:hypothetical protein